MSNLMIIGAAITSNSVGVKVSVNVKNEGQMIGSEVVQLYVSYPDIGLTQPPLQLRGFTKVHDVQPGASRKVFIELDKYAFSYWDESKSAWRVARGEYKLHVGFNCDHVVGTEEFEIKKGFVWTGL